MRAALPPTAIPAMDARDNGRKCESVPGLDFGDGVTVLLDVGWVFWDVDDNSEWLGARCEGKPAPVCAVPWV